MMEFDDSLLDDPVALQRADERLRALAGLGARVRLEAEVAERTLAGIDIERPRAVIALGPEARLIRAVLEPSCPVPFVAWPHEALPAWVGPLDVVIVLAGGAQTPGLARAAAEATRRGARMLVAAPDDSVVAEVTAGRQTTLVPLRTGDPLAAALVLLMALQAVGLGPATAPEAVAQAADDVAEACGPRLDLAQNKAKGLAVALADAVPLVWGGTMLAARASRRVAEALREASGRPALAGEADHLLPLLAAAPARDPFADPDELPERPSLLILDDVTDDPALVAAKARLAGEAEVHDVRVSELDPGKGGPVERYVALLAGGLWAAEYLRLGLGRV